MRSLFSNISKLDSFAKRTFSEFLWCKLCIFKPTTIIFVCFELLAMVLTLQLFRLDAFNLLFFFQSGSTWPPRSSFGRIRSCVSKPFKRSLHDTFRQLYLLRNFALREPFVARCNYLSSHPFAKFFGFGPGTLKKRRDQDYCTS